MQAGFERIWGLPAGPWHKIWRQAVWLAALIAYIYAAATVGSVTNGGLAETAGRVAVAVVLGIAFFWWGLRFLIGGRVSYLAAMPGAVATLVGLAGLRTFSGLVFEPLIVSERGQLRRAGHRSDRGVVADRRRLGRLRRPIVRALVLRRLAEGLGTPPPGSQGAGRRGGGRAVHRQSKHAARVVGSGAPPRVAEKPTVRPVFPTDVATRAECPFRAQPMTCDDFRQSVQNGGSARVRRELD